jgi:hypothetical protein
MAASERAELRLRALSRPRGPLPKAALDSKRMIDVRNVQSASPVPIYGQRYSLLTSHLPGLADFLYVGFKQASLCNSGCKPLQEE